jgi:hypothetical protein
VGEFIMGDMADYDMYENINDDELLAELGV